MTGVVTAEASDLLRAVGNTPLIELTDLDRLPPGVRLFGKLESCNPGGSIKDRPVARMLTRAIADGHLRDGRRLLDSSSGNAGIAYAQFGAALGAPVTLVVPENASQERLDRIAAHGAELILTDALEGYDFAIQRAGHLARTQGDKYWYCNQYANEHNWKAHYEGTGGEILAQVLARTGGLPAAFVAGIGTGGTITGVGRRLKEAGPGTHVTAVIPEEFPGIEGLKPLRGPADITPEILDEGVIDERTVLDAEEALDFCRRLADRGLFVGPSSGACVAAALRVAGRGTYATVITVLSDGGDRYGSTGMWRRT